MINLTSIDIILIILITSILVWVLKEYFKIGFKKLQEIFSIVPGFWWIVFSLIILAIPSYILVFHLSNDLSLDRNLSLLNTIVTLIFAVFIGYYAFVQVAENRAEKNLETGRNLLHRMQQYVKAMYYYELAIRFKINDFNTTAELLELYLVNSEDEKFASLLTRFESKSKKYFLDKYDNVIIFYLKITKEIFDGNIRKAESLIREAIKYIQDHPGSIKPGLWGFEEIKAAGRYAELGSATDSKKYIDNFILFITNQLDQSKKERFINGDFRLD